MSPDYSPHAGQSGNETTNELGPPPSRGGDLELEGGVNVSL